MNHELPDYIPASIAEYIELVRGNMSNEKASIYYHILANNPRLTNEEVDLLYSLFNIKLYHNSLINEPGITDARLQSEEQMIEKRIDRIEHELQSLHNNINRESQPMKLTAQDVKTLIESGANQHKVKSAYAMMLQNDELTIPELKEIESLYDDFIAATKQEPKPDGFALTRDKKPIPNTNATIVRHTYQNLDMVDFDLQNMKLISCQFIDCNMPGAKMMSCVFVNVQFTRCNFAGVDLSDSSLIDCIVRECDFTGANLSEMIIAKSFLKKDDFTKANFDRAQIIRSTTKESIFYDTGMNSNDGEFLNINCWIL